MRTILVFFVVALFRAGAADAQVPQTMHYQGVLTDASGVAVPDGGYNLTFRIYDHISEGILQWSETLPVQVTKGVFNAVLGSSTALLIPFDRPYYMAVSVNGGPESLRTPLASSPYSLNARSVADGAVTTAKIADNAVTAAKISPNVVSSVDGVANDGGNVDLVAGSNITITPDDAANTVTITATGVGGGDITSVAAGTGLSGGGASGDVTLAVAVPLSLSGNTGAASLIAGVNAGDGPGVQGGNGGGNYGFCGSGMYGLYGYASAGGRGVSGEHASGRFGEMGTSDYGVYGQYSGGGYGYIGGSVTGVFGAHSSGNNGSLGVGISGVSGAHANGRYGYLGHLYYGAFGVYEFNGNYGYLGAEFYGACGWHATTDNHGFLGTSNYGAYGESASQYGVRGISESSYGMYATSATSTALRAIRTGGGDWAGRFSGNVEVTGTLTKGGGSFKIDHPLDPENKYLYHSFVESSDMMNVYNGNVDLDGSGEAVVELPAWFEALNRDFRYQLTAIGAPAPDLHVASKIAGNRFRVAGGTPGGEVSWQVTGVRRDAFANAHRVPVETDKPAAERGKYLYARELGKPESAGIEYEEMRKQEEELRASRERREKIR